MRKTLLSLDTMGTLNFSFQHLSRGGNTTKETSISQRFPTIGTISQNCFSTIVILIIHFISFNNFLKELYSNSEKNVQMKNSTKQ